MAQEKPEHPALGIRYPTAAARSVIVQTAADRVIAWHTISACGLWPAVIDLWTESGATSIACRDEDSARAVARATGGNIREKRLWER